MKDRLVEGERGFFVASAQQSFTLPSRYYLEPDILQQETQKIFLRSWLYVGHISDLPELGSYMTMELAGQPIVVILGQNKELRVFFNVCQHRGHILLDGRGQVKNRIVCPYHAWCYGLDGELKTARLTRDVPGFERADFGLKIVQHALVALAHHLRKVTCQISKRRSSTICPKCQITWQNTDLILRLPPTGR